MYGANAIVDALRNIKLRQLEPDTAALTCSYMRVGSGRTALAPPFIPVTHSRAPPFVPYSPPPSPQYHHNHFNHSQATKTEWRLSGGVWAPYFRKARCFPPTSTSRQVLRD